MPFYKSCSLPIILAERRALVNDFDEKFPSFSKLQTHLSSWSLRVALSGCMGLYHNPHQTSIVSVPNFPSRPKSMPSHQVLFLRSSSCPFPNSLPPYLHLIFLRLIKHGFCIMPIPTKKKKKPSTNKHNNGRGQVDGCQSLRRQGFGWASLEGLNWLVKVDLLTVSLMIKHDKLTIKNRKKHVVYYY